MINEIISQGPEVPEPKQLDLFGKETSAELSEVRFPHHSDGEPIEHHSRDPTELNYPVQGSGQKAFFDLNEAQKKLAGALHRKSKALVFKHFQASIQEEQ